MSFAKRFICLMMVLLMMGILAACGGRVRGYKELGIANRIEALENCFHELDLEGIMDCIDPQDTAVVKTALTGISLVTGEDTDALLEKTESELYTLACILFDSEDEWPDVEGEEVLSELLNSVSIEADEISFGKERKDTALANCIVTICVGEEEITSRVELYMVKSDGEWYLDIPD